MHARPGGVSIRRACRALLVERSTYHTAPVEPGRSRETNSEPGPVRIGKGTKIYPFVTIQEPVIIGENEIGNLMLRTPVAFQRKSG